MVYIWVDRNKVFIKLFMYSRFEQDSILRRVDLGYSGTLRRV